LTSSMFAPDAANAAGERLGARLTAWDEVKWNR
jgi:hypothetical protein